MQYFISSENNEKIEAVNTKQMIEIDRLAIEKYGPNLFQMMENAGRNLALTIIDLTKNIENPEILILSGIGGNGGGGICAARHLANHNFNVTLAVTDETKLGEIPKEQYKLYLNADGKIVDKLDAQNPDIIVDSIIGYSLLKEPHGKAKEFINWSNSKKAMKLSLDIPSGINSTDGNHSNVYFITDVTMTLALPKTGLTEKYCGKLLLADIGIPKKVYEDIGIVYHQPFRNKFIIKIEEQ